MLSVTATAYDDVIVLQLKGRLDVKAAKDADEAFASAAAELKDVVLDMKDLEYIASAGLRSLKRLRGATRENGCSLTLKNVQSEVMEVFEMTGFAAMLNIE